MQAVTIQRFDELLLSFSVQWPFQSHINIALLHVFSQTSLIVSFSYIDFFIYQVLILVKIFRGNFFPELANNYQELIVVRFYSATKLFAKLWPFRHTKCYKV